MQNSIHKTPFLQARTKGKLSSLKGLLLLCLFLCGSASADDTDIYLEHSIGTGLKGPPMVMLTLDLRPNLGSTSCSNVLASCSSGTCAGSWPRSLCMPSLQLLFGNSTGSSQTPLLPVIRTLRGIWPRITCARQHGV